MLYSLVHRYRRVGGIYCLHFKGGNYVLTFRYSSLAIAVYYARFEVLKVTILSSGM
jgi:hypothetical protein